MPNYRLPTGYTIEQPGCTVAKDSITLPFPIPLLEARRLVFLATVARTRTAKEAGPFLGRSSSWVCHVWRGYKLPFTEMAAPSSTVPTRSEQPEVDRFLAMVRDSQCTVCHQIAAWLADMICLPLPIRFDEARRVLLFAVLHRFDNDRSRTAAELGVARLTVYQWCARYGIPLRRKSRILGDAKSPPRLKARRKYTAKKSRRSDRRCSH